jgi:hypothetical protein
MKTKREDNGPAFPEQLEDGTMLKALQAAIEEGEASADFDDFDPERNLARLNARHDG